MDFQNLLEHHQELLSTWKATGILNSISADSEMKSTGFFGTQKQTMGILHGHLS